MPGCATNLFREPSTPETQNAPTQRVERRVIFKSRKPEITDLPPTFQAETLVASHRFLRPAFPVPASCRQRPGSCAPMGADKKMIDRNARARLGAKIRADKRLTHATRSVANAALFSATDARSGRCQAFRARLAHEAGCSRRSVTRATQALQDAGYLAVVPTWGRRHCQDGRRWYRPRGANVLEWRIPADFFVSAKLAADPSSKYKTLPPAPLPEGLSKVLERFGHTIADRSGHPRTP